MNINAFLKLTESFGPTPKMPVLFLGHGNPMNAIQENEFVIGFHNIAKKLPRPKAVLCVSAHWLTRGTYITAMPTPRTIHDFGGFPKALFEVQYPAPGSPLLAEATQELLGTAKANLDHEWGLDHGAWTVLMHLFPDADIPVVQLSIDYHQPGEYHFNLAGQLAKLRERGVLIVGSGNIVHNLRMVDFRNIDRVDYGFDWAAEARDIINKYILNGDFKPLLQYEKLGKAAQLAIPTPDHYYPLLYALGLQEQGEDIKLYNDKMVGGSLSMTSVYIS
jgi:4,5-DOPA dioxygenase extradiol